VPCVAVALALALLVPFLNSLMALTVVLTVPPISLLLPAVGFWWHARDGGPCDECRSAWLSRPQLRVHASLMVLAGVVGTPIAAYSAYNTLRANDMHLFC
jgi:hypothetical protein